MRNNSYKYHFIVFLTFLLLQVLLINKINTLLNSKILIHLYLVPLLWLPINMNKYAILLYAFMLGFIIDFFAFSIGLCSSLTLLIGFVRNYLLKVLASKEKESKFSPSIKLIGLPYFIIYISILYLLYFVFLTFLEYFQMYSVLYLIGFIFYNTVINVGLVLIVEIFKNKKMENTY